MSFVKCCFDAGEGHDILESFVQKCTDPGCEYIKFCFIQDKVLFYIFFDASIYRHIVAPNWLIGRYVDFKIFCQVA